MYTIHALRNFYIDFPIPALAMYFQEKMDQTVEIAGYIWLVRNASKTIVVDAGIGQPPEIIGAGKQMLGHFTIAPGEDTASLLRGAGVNPADVDYLILTHLHTDHSFNTPLFTKATIVVSRYGWETVSHPAHPALYPSRLYSQEALRYIREEARDRLRLVAKEEEILPGISVIYTGGHTPCSQSVRVQTEAGKAVITGDVVSLYGHIEENIPVAYCHDLLQCYQAMDRIRQEGGVILPSHDPEVLIRHPGGKIG
jgi:glyoxylase-like metal-dependent hydrolase (beta-lactamase superfamily II)